MFVSSENKDHRILCDISQKKHDNTIVNITDLRNLLFPRVNLCMKNSIYKDICTYIFGTADMDDYAATFAMTEVRA